MIVNDHKGATYVATSAVTLGLFLSSFSIVRAADEPAAPAAVAAPAALATAAPVTSVSVTLVQDDLETTFSTAAKTVGDFLIERGITPADDDYISSPLDQALSDGARIVYRAAVPIVIENGRTRATLRTSAATVADVLREARIAFKSSDEISADLSSRPLAHEIVRVSHISSWTGNLVQTIAQRVMHRYDASLPKGTQKTVSAGRPGERMVEIRYVRRDDSAPVKTVVATRIVRSPEPKVIAIGTAVAAPPAASFASVAQQGLASAVRIAGNALHMIATAYTATCYGCTGITAMGLHAGHGIVAVDPHVIPLGTKLFIPGYGPAIAGDTGGAINGYRIDLGMNSVGQALQFGRRPITVYVIR